MAMTVPAYCSRCCSTKRDRFRVEVVGRFVKQQHIRLLQQNDKVRETTFLTARQVGHIRFRIRTAQRIHGDLDFVVKLPSPCGIDGILYLP